MKHILSLLLLCISLSLTGQPLRDINYSYLYDPTSDFSFDMKVVRGIEWNVFYKLEVKDTSMRVANYTVQWETRDELSDKEGTALSPEVNILQEQKTLSGGSFRVATSATPKILSAKVINSKTKRAWIYYRVLSPEYPVITYLKKNDEVIFKPYVNITDQVSTASENWVVSYYEDNFPAALPPFSETQGRVNKGMKTDSTFSITGSPVSFSQKGLYLLQKDTSAVEGLAFRSEDDYPRYAKIQSLAGPMVYVCTKQEYDRLVLAKGDKKAFDRIVLGMTADTDRAKKFIRNYFRRVELANQLFTSYKEGWKTDRGMIFIIFGLPDEVLKFSDRETWSYKNDDYNVTFNFSKSPSLFDPENYVLIRDKKYTQTWYEVIDLWRNARF
jgi:GWxTD domain-containing protein